MPETDPRVAAAVERRRLELGLTVNDLIDRSGVSAPTLNQVRQGLVLRYKDATKLGVARALRWPHDALDRLYAGDDPDASWDQPALDVVATERTIAADPLLSDAEKDMLIAAYRAAVSQRR